MKKEMTMVKKVAEKVSEAGGKMYFVGGFVRDRQLGKDSKDIDVEIHGITPAKVLDILSSFGEVDKVGESFGVFLIKGIDVDFAMPRHEIKTGEKHTDFDVTVDPFIGTYGASKRRDFTMNAIMEDVLTGDIIDHFDGLGDIVRHEIKLVNEITFQEDALRVLRAIQFSARFAFGIEEGTRKLMETMSLDGLAPERIYCEIEKGMEKGHPSIFIAQMKSFSNVSSLIPELGKVETSSMKKNNSLAQNVAMMGLRMSDDEFVGLVKGFIQGKQARKQANQTKRFILDVQEADSKFAMALTIAKHRQFLEKYRTFIDLNLSTAWNRESAEQLVQMMQVNDSLSLKIDGKWLMDRGLQPSPTFSEKLNEAIAFSLLGFNENKIMNSIV